MIAVYCLWERTLVDVFILILLFAGVHIFAQPQKTWKIIRSLKVNRAAIQVVDFAWII